MQPRFYFQLCSNYRMQEKEKTPKGREVEKSIAGRKRKYRICVVEKKEREKKERARERERESLPLLPTPGIKVRKISRHVQHKSQYLSTLTTLQAAALHNHRSISPALKSTLHNRKLKPISLKTRKVLGNQPSA